MLRYTLGALCTIATIFASSPIRAETLIVDPESFAAGDKIVVAGMSFTTAAGSPVYSVQRYHGAFGDLAFGNLSGSCSFCWRGFDWDGAPIIPNPYNTSAMWIPEEVLVASFERTAQRVSLYFIPNDDADPALFAAYDAFGNLLASDELGVITVTGQRELLTVFDPLGRIRSVAAAGTLNDIELDLMTIEFVDRGVVTEPVATAMLGVAFAYVLARRFNAKEKGGKFAGYRA